MSGTELDATYHDLVTRLAYIQARKAELTDEETQLKAKIAENITHGTYTINGKPALTVSTGHRFNPTLAAQILPPALATLCQVTTIDSKRAKAVLPPDLYAQCQKPNDNTTVTVN
ncbi:MAG: hypothetical protein LC749_17755 [Actinobacteria bacterium]|nr:hypothetical protein [Actinomycetota bacterium]